MDRIWPLARTGLLGGEIQAWGTALAFSIFFVREIPNTNGALHMTNYVSTWITSAKFKLLLSHLPCDLGKESWEGVSVPYW